MNIGLIYVSSDAVMATKESGSYPEYLTSHLSHFKKLTSYLSVNLVHFLLSSDFILHIWLFFQWFTSSHLKRVFCHSSHLSHLTWLAPFCGLNQDKALKFCRRPQNILWALQVIHNLNYGIATYACMLWHNIREKWYFHTIFNAKTFLLLRWV